MFAWVFFKRCVSCAFEWNFQIFFLLPTSHVCVSLENTDCHYVWFFMEKKSANPLPAFGWFLVGKKADTLCSSADLFIVDSSSVAFQDRKDSFALSAQNVLFALAINNESLCRSTLEVLLLFWQLGLASAPSFLWRFILPRHSLNTDNVDPLASMVMLERGIFLLSSPCSLKAYWIMRQPNGNNLHEYSASLFKVNVIWRRVKNIS